MNFPSLKTLCFKHLLKEDSKSEVPEEDLDKAPLGKYAFAPDRTDPVPEELNTSDEEHLYVGLRKHLIDNKPLANDQAAEIKDILSHDWYRTIFKEPTGTYVFRGMVANNGFMRKMNINVHGSKNGVLEKRFIYDPHENVGSSSWTTENAIARLFTMNNEEEKPFSVILVARVSDNPEVFIEGKGGFYKLRVAKDVEKEKEVIALGSVRVCKLYWQDNFGKYASTYSHDIDEEDANEDE